MSTSARDHRSYLAVAVVIFIAGAVFRLLYLAMPSLDADMAMWGVEALDLLQGRISFFFASELFGGNLEAWLAAPLIALFGPTASVLCIPPFLFSLGLIGAVYLLGRRELGQAGGLAAMAWTALCPYYLLWHSVLPRGAYIEIPFFAVLCFWLTLDLVRGRQGARPFWLGFLCGLGLWTHVLMIPVMATCFIFILWQRPRLLLTRHLPWALAGLFLGGLPIWLIAVPAGLLGTQGPAGQMSLNIWLPLGDLMDHGLAILLGLQMEDMAGVSWRFWRTSLVGLYLLGLITIIYQKRRTLFARFPTGQGFLSLLILYVIMHLAFWVVSGAYSNVWRHLTPLYAVIPFLFGLMIAALVRAGRAWAGLAVAVVLSFNLWSSPDITLLNPELRAAYLEHRAQERLLYSFLKFNGYTGVYGHEFWQVIPLSYYSGLEATFADQIANHIPRFTHLADITPKGCYVFTSRTEDLTKTLDLAGVRYRKQQLTRFSVLDQFSLAVPNVEEVQPSGWQSPMAGAKGAWDRVWSTRWSLGRARKPGDRFLLDLGRVIQDVCRVDIMSGRYSDFATGLAFRVSVDGKNWDKIGQNDNIVWPMFWSLNRPLARFLPARQELRLAPRPVRYVEITSTGPPFGPYWWSIHEIFVFKRAQTNPPRAKAQELARIIREISPRGPVYGPPEVIALLPGESAGYQAYTLPVGQRYPLRFLDLDLRPGTVFCLPQEAWPASEKILQGHLRRPPRVTPVGSWVVIHGLDAAPGPVRMSPLPKKTSFKASVNQNLTSMIMDGKADTRWHTGAPQRPGQSLEINLGKEVEICGLHLDTGQWAQDDPRGLEVWLSRDGRAWRPAPDLHLVKGKVLWGGNRVLAENGPFLASFTPATARHIRLVQTGQSEVYYWTVTGMSLLTPAPKEVR